MAAAEVVLTEPIEVGDEKITKLSFRKPTAGDVRRMPAMPEAQNVGHIIDLASALTGQPVAVLNRLCLKDLALVSEVVNSF